MVIVVFRDIEDQVLEFFIVENEGMEPIIHENETMLIEDKFTTQVKVSEKFIQRLFNWE